LRNVLGVLALAQHLHADSKHHGLKPLDEFARALLVAFEAESNQGGVIRHKTPCVSLIRVPHTRAFGFSKRGPPPWLQPVLPFTNPWPYPDGVPHLRAL
jgi:hypothetical protein